MKTLRSASKRVHFGVIVLTLSLTGAFLTGCPVPPETVAFVDLARYAGTWYQVAGYSFFPTRNLVGVTAEYTPQQDGTVRVVNRGFNGGFDGPEQVLEGYARVVDTTTNAKLEVTFPSIFAGLFKGEYWIIALDDADYSYAVVSDSRRSTLFILSRTPVMPSGLLDAIIDDLVARGYDRDRIIDFPQAAP